MQLRHASAGEIVEERGRKDVGRGMKSGLLSRALRPTLVISAKLRQVLENFGNTTFSFFVSQID
jgi:hypothetical protein